jgi:acylphosphatase
MTGDTVRAHVYILGKVQGVSFRATTVDKANEQDVDGWVKNLPDGRVEAVFEGIGDAVESMIDFCHDGPSRAHVKTVDVEYEEARGVDGFTRRN